MLATDPYEAAQHAADHISRRTQVARHRVAVVLGTGWASLVDHLGKIVHSIPMTEIPGFPEISVSGHVPQVVSVDVDGVPALVLQGRTHLYEGYEPHQVVHGVRSAVLAGCDTVVITNAAGGIRPGLSVGQAILISDHVNLLGRSPLTGPPPPEPYGTRFLDLTEIYQPELRDLARDADASLIEGVYGSVPGPHFETPAEVRMLATLGIDVIGMSTTLEAIAAHQLKARVLGISVVTNIAAGITGKAVVHEEILDAGANAMTAVAPVIRTVIAAQRD
ncbi:purine-nucleoside phosphorylase [Spongiactinospora sp. TRM90649]|uniref:purine-nucleoside phosphorylase n=1 Tax=Spongiactinospora sp. TRM90649 TaxID=3031114 RepID=UPI0023F78137|nr:purine-nucleoside phosphorylase [Spongiactinospora sp. TRM90649]MDF5751637.1 purine-nucleoside phosphorylase [Spongiactinospora sp. TRM90649]